MGEWNVRFYGFLKPRYYRTVEVMNYISWSVLLSCRWRHLKFCLLKYSNALVYCSRLQVKNTLTISCCSLHLCWFFLRFTVLTAVTGLKTMSSINLQSPTQLPSFRLVRTKRQKTPVPEQTSVPGYWTSCSEGSCRGEWIVWSWFWSRSRWWRRDEYISWSVLLSSWWRRTKKFTDELVVYKARILALDRSVATIELIVNIRLRFVVFGSPPWSWDALTDVRCCYVNAVDDPGFWEAYVWGLVKWSVLSARWDARFRLPIRLYPLSRRNDKLFSSWSVLPSSRWRQKDVH